MLAVAIPAALGGAIYPQALLFVAFLLTRSDPRRHALVFLAGAALIALGVGFAAVLVLQGTGLENAQHRTIPPWIDLGLGVLLILFAVVVYVRPPHRAGKSRQRRELGLVSVFAIGVFMYSPSPFYLASLHAIAEGHPGVVATALSVVLVAAIYLLMAEIPIAAHAIWPEATLRGVGTVNGWLSRHGRTLLCVAAAGFGLYLVGAAAAHLA